MSKVTIEYDMNEIDPAGNYLGTENEESMKVALQAKDMYFTIDEVLLKLNKFEDYYVGSYGYHDGFEHITVHRLTEDHYQGVEIALAILRNAIIDNNIRLDLLS